LKANIFSILILSLATLSGCAGRYEKAAPRQVGNNTYVITMEVTGLAMIRSKKSELVSQANANCDAMGKKMARISDTQNRDGKLLEYTVELQYECY
jgi:hypothetical protein